MPEVQNAFAATDGLDPLFRPNDTADGLDADFSQAAARQLLNTVSVFRQPMVNLNLAFDSSLLWDRRESITGLERR